MVPSTDPRLACHRLTIDLGALAANYRLMAERSAPAKAAAVVKANAYGIGITHAVPALMAAGCDTFFVAMPDEGLALRRIAREARIFVLGGIFAEAVPDLVEAGLMPVLSSLASIEMWRNHAATLPWALHVDTGMNRLGLTQTEAFALASGDGRMPGQPVLVMSHLACADDPAHDLNRAQCESFQQVAALFPQSESSLANSAGILLGADYRALLTRPGIALYGGNPGRGDNPMRPVVTSQARIVQLRHAKAGQSVSYGATVKLARDTVIAVAGLGYADGLHRASSGSGVPLRGAVAAGGSGFVAGRRVPILGRITMDLTAFDVTDLPAGAVGEGDWIELFGPNIALDEAARAAGTISYELLTSLGRRAERRYVGGAG